MRRIFRYLFIGLGAAVLFLIGLIVVFVALFDANAYKDDLSALVLEQSGRDLQFHGDVSLTVFPALGVKLGAMSLSNAPGFGPQPMVKVTEASLSVDLRSLIRLQPEVEQLVLRDLKIDLQTNTEGVTNWNDLTAANSATEVEADTREEDSSSISRARLRVWILPSLSTMRT